MTEHARYLEYLRVADLVPAPVNPKRHDIEQLTASMARFGYTAPIERDERTGKLVSGHGRAETLLLLQTADAERPDGIDVDPDGHWLVPVIRGWSSHNDEEAAAYLVAANQTTIGPGWDPVELRDLVASMNNTEGLGWDDDEIAHMLNDVTVAEALGSRDEPYVPHRSIRIEITDDATFDAWTRHAAAFDNAEAALAALLSAELLLLRSEVTPSDDGVDREESPV